jgi:phosphohistidine phosphatase
MSQKKQRECKVNVVIFNFIFIFVKTKRLRKFIMKKLVLLRHANAELELGMSDIQRKLSLQGLREIKKLAPTLKEKVISFDEIHYSAAVRTTQTTQSLSDYFDTNGKILRAEPNFYNAEEEVYQQFIENGGFKDASNTVLIVGHNPGISQFLNFYVKDYFYSLSTCCAAILSTTATKWSEMNASNTNLDEILDPSQL